MSPQLIRRFGAWEITSPGAPAPPGSPRLPLLLLRACSLLLCAVCRAWGCSAGEAE